MLFELTFYVCLLTNVSVGNNYKFVLYMLLGAAVNDLFWGTESRLGLGTAIEISPSYVYFYHSGAPQRSGKTDARL
jgi:hypothetical protein